MSLHAHVRLFVELDQLSGGAEAPGRRSSVVLFGGLSISVFLVL